jgi:hypothetical protein
LIRSVLPTVSRAAARTTDAFAPRFKYRNGTTAVVV